MAAIVTLTMNPALDLTSDAEALDPGHKTRCAPPRRTPGGGGINVARGLRQLGDDVLAIYPSGGPTGERFGQLLAQLDVPARTLPIAGDLRQNLSLRAHDTGEVLHLVFPGPELGEQEWQACDDAMASLDPAPDLVVMSGSLPPGVPLDFYAGVARRVAGRGGRVVLDTNGPALRATLDAGAPLHLIKPNRNECRELFDVAGDDPDDYLAALDDILRDGAAAAVVVTLGAQGAVLASRDLRVHLRPPAIEGRAPVGAGDSFVMECTGVFRDQDSLRQHLEAGARRVILSAPSKDDEVPMVVPGINEPGAAPIFSCASCTTNCITPVSEVMARRIGIAKAMMTTVHAYTSSQGMVDGPADRMERGRAGAVNLVPTSTGAAAATTKVLTDLSGLFDGLAVRAPVPVGSVADITFVTTGKTSVDAVNKVFLEESLNPRYNAVLGIVEEPMVSSDIIGDKHAAVVDLTQTRVVDGDLVKVLAWYDNEMGYAAQMVRAAVKVA